jgi:hypothetical protein
MSNPFKVGDIVIRTGGFQSEIQTGTRCEVLGVQGCNIRVKVLDERVDGVPASWEYIAANFALVPQKPQKDEAL